jgi:hypothetical protein
MTNHDPLKNALTTTEKKLLAQNERTLQGRLDAIQIGEDERNKLVQDRLGKVVRDKALGLFKVTQVIKEIIDWNTGVEGEIKERKKQYLLSAYFDKCDDNTDAIEALKRLLTDPQGSTLFSKILRILDENPPDETLFQRLASALKYIAQSNFSALFEDHKYALGQIDQMTPQSLAILSDATNWPEMSLASYSSNGGLITSDFSDEFSSAYSSVKGISEIAVKRRLEHCVNDLRGKKLIEARLTSEKPARARCVLTNIGQLLARYLS